MAYKRTENKPKVPQLWIASGFEIWLKTNLHRFNRVPYIFKQSKRGVTYRFKGVTGRIELYIDKHQFMITVGNYDSISEWDISLRLTKAGKYFCGMEIPKHRRYFSSRSRLLSSHCFEPLIKWANSNLTSGKILVIQGKPRYWSSASIMDSSDAGRKNKFIRFRYPVMLEKSATTST